jgi:hypothetical protein
MNWCKNIDHTFSYMTDLDCIFFETKSIFFSIRHFLFLGNGARCVTIWAFNTYRYLHEDTSLLAFFSMLARVNGRFRVHRHSVWGGISDGHLIFELVDLQFVTFCVRSISKIRPTIHVLLRRTCCFTYCVTSRSNNSRITVIYIVPL